MKDALKPMAVVLVFVGLTVSVGLAQDTHVTITDNKGNSAMGAIDSHGNVFLQGNKGQLTFGTVHDGDVFLTDSKGVITTGQISGGSILLFHSDGSVTTGSYYGSTAYMTTTPSTAERERQNAANAELQRERMQAAGAQMGAGVAGIAIGITRMVKLQHLIKRTCSDPDTQFAYRSDGRVAANCDVWRSKHPQKAVDVPKVQIGNGHIESLPATPVSAGATFKSGGGRTTSLPVRGSQASPVSQPPVTAQAASKSEFTSLGIAGYSTDQGFKVTSVPEGSPAAQVLDSRGDVIWEIDGKRVRSGQDIDSAIAANKEATIKVTNENWIPPEREVKLP